jgi:cytoskeletal protein RodZ
MSGEPPRKRHSPAVYRRRRIVLLVGVVAVIALVWLLIAQPWRGAAVENTASTPSATSSASPRQTSASPTPSETVDAAAEPTATPTSTPQATASATPTATPTARPCVARDITVEPVSDQDTYAPGQNPQLSITLTNNGGTDCTLNVGTSAQAFTIVSGSDVWWRSTDCQTEPSDMIVLLAAGQSVSSAAPLVWDRTRSAVGSCGDSGRQSAPGGGASYHLSVEIGGIASTNSKQILLY